MMAKQFIRGNRWLRLVLIAAMMMGLASSMLAAHSVHAQSASTDLEQFRVKLATFLAEVDAALARYAPPGAADGIAKVRQDVPSLTAQDLAALREGFPKGTAFWDSWKTLGPALATVAKPTPPPSGHLMSHACPPGTPLGVADEIIADSVEKAAEIALAVVEALPDLASSVPATIAAGVWGATSIAAHVIRSINAVNAECEDNNHANILHNVVGPRVDDKLDEKVSSRATQGSVDSRASQGSLNAHDSNMANLFSNAHHVPMTAQIDSRANQLGAQLQTHDTDIKNLVNSRANQLEAKLQQHDVDMKALLNAKANQLEAKLQQHDTDVKALVNARANQLEAKLQQHDTDVKSAIDTRANRIDATLANVTDLMKINDFQVIEVKAKQRYLLVTSEAGVPVNVSLMSVKVSPLKAEKPIAFQDVTANATVTPAGPGILDVKLNLPKGVEDAKLYEFRVKHAHGMIPPIGNVDHFGVTVFSSKGDD